MAIIIKKRTVADARQPAPLVDPAVAAPVKKIAAAAPLTYTPYNERPVAKTAEELKKSRAGTMRAPNPTECSFCHNSYCYPCHGQSPNCMQVVWRNPDGSLKK